MIQLLVGFSSTSSSALNNFLSAMQLSSITSGRALGFSVCMRAGLNDVMFPGLRFRKWI